MNFGHFFQKLQNSNPTSFPPHFPLTTSPNPTHSLPLPQPAKWPRRGHSPHPSLFARKPLSSIKIPTPLQKSQPINSYTFANHSFLSFTSSRENPLQDLLLPQARTLAPRTQFTSISRLQGLPLGLHQRAPSSINTPQSNIKSKFFNPSFNNLWMEAITFILGSSS